MHLRKCRLRIADLSSSDRGIIATCLAFPAAGVLFVVLLHEYMLLKLAGNFWHLPRKSDILDFLLLIELNYSLIIFLTLAGNFVICTFLLLFRTFASYHSGYMLPVLDQGWNRLYDLGTVSRGTICVGTNSATYFYHPSDILWR